MVAAKKGRKKKTAEKPMVKIGKIAVWCSFDEIVDVINVKPNPENRTALLRKHKLGHEYSLIKG